MNGLCEGISELERINVVAVKDENDRAVRGWRDARAGTERTRLFRALLPCPALIHDSDDDDEPGNTPGRRRERRADRVPRWPHAGLPSPLSSAPTMARLPLRTTVLLILDIPSRQTPRQAASRSRCSRLTHGTRRRPSEQSTATPATTRSIRRATLATLPNDRHVHPTLFPSHQFPYFIHPRRRPRPTRRPRHSPSRSPRPRPLTFPTCNPRRPTPLRAIPSLLLPTITLSTR